ALDCAVAFTSFNFAKRWQIFRFLSVGWFCVEAFKCNYRQRQSVKKVHKPLSNIVNISKIHNSRFYAYNQWFSQTKILKKAVIVKLLLVYLKVTLRQLHNTLLASYG